ncbi:MAG TPA: hypothetical protein VHN20_11685, partial [Beijerinckiaceae bacterium]|nr:hypothetical protein [Beijerinckiaceae bacterium]
MCIACAAAGRSASWASFDHFWPDAASALAGEWADASDWPGVSPAGPARYAASGIGTAPSGVPAIDALIDGMHWDGPVTYGFPTSASAYEPGYAEARNGFASVSPAMAQ